MSLTIETLRRALEIYTISDSVNGGRALKVDITSITPDTVIAYIKATSDTSGTTSLFRSLTVDSAAQAIKASSGNLYGWNIINLHTAPIYVKIYNKAAASVNPASDTPVRTLLVAASGTAKIPEVDTTKSAVFYLGGTATATASPSLARISSVTLTDSKTVTRTSGSSATSTTNFVVVEFQPVVIQSIQQFTTNQSGVDSSTTTNVTISSVVMANTFIAYGSRDATSDNTYTIELTSSTNVRLTKVAAIAVSRNTRYAVIEFVSGILKSNQFVNIALTSLTSNTATITAVDTSKTVGLWNGYNSSTSDTAGNTLFLGVTLTNSTTVTGTVNASSANTKRIAAQFIEFY